MSLKIKFFLGFTEVKAGKTLAISSSKPKLAESEEYSTGGGSVVVITVVDFDNGTTEVSITGSVVDTTLLFAALDTLFRTTLVVLGLKVVVVVRKIVVVVSGVVASVINLVTFLVTAVRLRGVFLS